MITTSLRRLGRFGASFLGITIVTFCLLRLAPGEPIAAQTSVEGAPGITAGIEAWRELRGLDAQLPIQYGRWLMRLVSLDLGRSLVDERHVTAILAEALPSTLLLVGLALLLAYGLGVPLGVWAALHGGSRRERALRWASDALLATPTFWVALLLLTAFASGRFVAWLPLRGLDSAWHLLLPVTCLAYAPLLRVARYQRNAMTAALREEFVRTARAKGLPARTVLWRHAFPVAAAPIVALLSVDVPWLVGGSVVVERVFTIPGMGWIAFEAVLRRDYPLILGTTVLAALATLVSMLAAEVLLRWLQPRAEMT